MLSDFEEDEVSREDAAKALARGEDVWVMENISSLGTYGEEIQIHPCEVDDDDGEILPGEYDFFIFWHGENFFPATPEEALSEAEGLVAEEKRERTAVEEEWERKAEQRKLSAKLGSEIE